VRGRLDELRVEGRQRRGYKPACRRVGVHADLLGRRSAGLCVNPDVGLEADAPRGAYIEIARTSISSSPKGTISPTALPMSKRARGAVYEIEP
jgi:hypothetical protein